MSSSRHRPSPTGRRHAEMSTAGGAQNMAHLLRLRQEGKIPASAGGGVLGGQTSSRAASAGLRSGDGGGRRGGAPGFGFRRNMGQHPSLVERLRHTATLRGHSGEDRRLAGSPSFALSLSLPLSLAPSLSTCTRGPCVGLSVRHLPAFLEFLSRVFSRAKR